MIVYSTNKFIDSKLSCKSNEHFFISNQIEMGWKQTKAGTNILFA